MLSISVKAESATSLIILSMKTTTLDLPHSGFDAQAHNHFSVGSSPSYACTIRLPRPCRYRSYKIPNQQTVF
jgi:hypothetical protein